MGNLYKQNIEPGIKVDQCPLKAPVAGFLSYCTVEEATTVCIVFCASQMMTKPLSIHRS